VHINYATGGTVAGLYPAVMSSLIKTKYKKLKNLINKISDEIIFKLIFLLIHFVVEGTAASYFNVLALQKCLTH